MELDEFRIDIKSKIDHIYQTVDRLDKKVATQNGRVDKLEQWRSFMSGAGMVILVFLAPIIIRVVSEIFKNGLNIGG